MTDSTKKSFPKNEKTRERKGQRHTVDIGDQNDGGLAIGGADSVGLEAAYALHDGSFARSRAQHRGVLAALCACHGRSRGETGD